MGERIRRTDLNQLMREYKGGAFFNYTPFMSQNFQRLQKVYVQNDTDADLDIGDVVFINGLPNTIDYDDLLSEYLSFGIIFSGAAYDSNHKDRLSAIALEPIKEDGVGEVYLPGIIAAKIYNYNASYGYARIDDGKIKSAQGGEYKVLGVSSANNSSECFGYVRRLTEGHYVGTTGSPITGPSSPTTVTVTNGPVISNVKCPLLSGTASIDSGKTVVISLNLFTGEWEITETVC